MADNTVTTKFVADPRDEVVLQLLKQQQETTKLQKRMLSLSQTTARGAKEGSTALSKMGAATTGLLGRFVSVSAAIGAITAGYREWTGQIEKATAASDAFNTSLLQGLATTGDLPVGPDVKKFIQNLPGITEEKGKAAFLGVAGGAPSLDVSKRKAVTAEVSRLAPFLDKASLTATGTVAGRLATIDPTKSANDLADLSVAVQAAAGDRIGQVSSAGFQRSTTQLIEQGGLDTETALALNLQGLEKGLRSETLSTVVSKLDPERGVTLDALFSNKKLAQKELGKETASKLDLLDFDAAQQQAEKLRQSQVGKHGGRLGRDVQAAIETDGATFIQETNAARREKKFRQQGNQSRDLRVLQDRTTDKTDGAERALNVGLDFVERGIDRFRTRDRSQVVRDIASGEAAQQANAIAKQNQLLEKQIGVMERIEQNTADVAKEPKSRRPPAAASVSR